MGFGGIGPTQLIIVLVIPILAIAFAIKLDSSLVN